MEQQVLSFQRGHHGSRNNASREEEETRERLSSLIRQKGLTGGRDADCYSWVLLAESSRDRFIILEGIHESCCLAARNDDFQLVAVGSAAASEDDGCAVYWPEATDLACVLHKIMRKKRNAANESEILQESAIRGLLIYHLVGCEAQFRRAEDEFWVYIPRSSVASSLRSLELEMQMLSRVLKPPSVLAAASPLLFARGHLDNTASSSNAPLVHTVP
ncbi:uncharacterized protein [Miscanthus floridulus]|uniref:uncharacterized protein isoform X2 n=1 Tax=Miscanthus floridulus TaxID=154761 RepID=UPI0034580B91